MLCNIWSTLNIRKYNNNRTKNSHYRMNKNIKLFYFIKNVTLLVLGLVYESVHCI